MKLGVPLFMLFLYVPLPLLGQRLVNPKRYHSDDDEEDYRVDYYDEDKEQNNSTDGMHLGAHCNEICSPKLHHVQCNPVSKVCECENKYPVRVNPYKGCTKPKRLGEQCYFREACMFTDPHSSCIQIHHNAICQCQPGYHSVSLQKPSKRIFCAEDLVVMTTDLSTLAGVISGIAVLSGLICFVLRLFNQNLYTGRHRYGNANLAPPILFSSDAAFPATVYVVKAQLTKDFAGSLPLPINDRSSTSRASSNRTYASFQSRRASSAQGCRGIAVSGSRAGSRRPSLASAHSNTSIRSYSAKRYEKEREQKEEREMQKRFSRMNSGNSTGKIPPTPSPHSTDDLLPTVEEDKQVPPLAIQEESSNSFHEEIPSTSKQYP